MSGRPFDGPIRTPARTTYLLALGYLVVSAVFSIGATALQWSLARLLVITHDGGLEPDRGRRVPGHRRHLPVDPLETSLPDHLSVTTRLRDATMASGAWGAFRMGVEHGAYCVGCCWALMLLLFAGGVMNLTVIAALTAFVAFEILSPLGVHTARVSGVLLIGAVAWMFFRA